MIPAGFEDPPMLHPFANVLVDNCSEARRVTRGFLIAGFSPPRLFMRLSNAEAAEPAERRLEREIPLW